MPPILCAFPKTTQGCTMPLLKMEHYLVMTDDIEKTKDFYRDVIGLEVGFRADLGFPGYWLYLGDTPVIHIAEWATYTGHSRKLGIPVTTRSASTGAFDHIAFNGTGAQQMIDKLSALGIAFHRNDVPMAALTQLFLFDPNGVKIELNYR
jgi:catechol 2,3-dioxygenase-like lactoylglutathione lyase family enzyme